MNLSLPLFDFDDDLQDDAPAASEAAALVSGVVTEAPALALTLPGVLSDPAPSEGPVAADDASHEPPGLDLALHPAVWRASQLGGGAQATSPSGFAALDAELPGGGWPHGVLTELLLPQPGIGELRLLAPTLAALSPPLQAAPSAAPAQRQGRSARQPAPADTARCVNCSARVARPRAPHALPACSTVRAIRSRPPTSPRLT